MAVVEIRKSWD
jgi:hypothetical protein